MIELNVESYCQNCPEFEPYVTKDDEVRTYADPVDFGAVKEIHFCDTRIYCKHRGRCASIYNRAREEMKEVKS